MTGGAARPGPREYGSRWSAALRPHTFTIIMIGVLVIGVLVLGPNIRLLAEQRAQLAELEATVAMQRDDVDTLRTELERWQDPAFIQSQARERLLFIYPGEVSYLVITPPEEAEAVDPGLLSTELQATETDWLEILTTSVFVSGTLTPADLETTPTDETAP